MQSRFNPKPAETTLQPGSNTIKGSAFMRKKTGVIVPAAGEVAWPIPATPGAEERFVKLFPSGKLNPATLPHRVVPTDPDYMRLTQQTKTNKNGSFTFENVKAGAWFVSITVIWV